METAVKLFDSIVKLRTGSEKHLHLHSKEDIAERLIDEIIGVTFDNNKDQKTLGDFGGDKNAK